MEIVQAGQIPEYQRDQEHREGSWYLRNIAKGTPGTTGNFQFVTARTSANFYSPRHHHNFDQFRYQLEGEVDFSRDGKLLPGVLGYFPEGTFYGPQTCSDNAVTLVLQFGGASGDGYLDQSEFPAAWAELKKTGHFENGVYHTVLPDGRPRNVDGYQAVWEYMNGRPMVYPKQRYEKPILMNPDSFDWVPVDGASEVFEKLLGVFSERHTEARFIKLSAGSRYNARGRGIYFVLHGGGKAGADPYEKWTTCVLERGEELPFVADQETEIMMLGLPRLREAALSIAAE